MESENGKGTTEHSNKNSEINHEDGKTSPDFSPASSISSSSSSTSSLEFEITEKDTLEPVFSPDITTAETPQWSMISASSPIGLEDHLSPETRSPPVQTMGQPAGYDPNRIPASIFSTKATNPSEWSVASNESLFSIHMGKSGELPRLDDWNTSPSTYNYVSEAKYCNEVSTSLPLSLPPVMEVSAHEESSETPGKNRRLKKGDVAYDEKMVRGDVALHHHHHCGGESGLTSSTRTSTSNPRLSDESGNSSSSFAFPVLMSDGIKTGSLKGVTEKPDQKPQLQAQVSKATPKSSTTRWFSWFYCSPRCC